MSKESEEDLKTSGGAAGGGGHRLAIYVILAAAFLLIFGGLGIFSYRRLAMPEYRTASLLSKLRDGGLKSVVVQWLKDWDILDRYGGDDREAVVEKLVEIGPDAMPTLLKGLKDEAPSVRWGAAEALGRIGGRQAISALETALRDDSAGEVRASAARACPPG